MVSSDRAVAAAALTRAVLVGRAVATSIAGAAGLLLVADRWRIAEVLAVVAAGTAIQLGLLARWPRLAARPLAALAADSVLVLAVLALGRGDIAYFCFAAGAGALAGVLLGLRAVPVWVLQAALGFAVIGTVLRRLDPPAELAAFVVALPLAGALAGLGASILTSALARYLELSRGLVASAQRSAAADERARLARELHDSGEQDPARRLPGRAGPADLAAPPAGPGRAARRHRRPGRHRRRPPGPRAPRGHAPRRARPRLRHHRPRALRHLERGHRRRRAHGPRADRPADRGSATS
ncbi:hypothetical protein GCM10020218_067200 [Dactylosporangium vinaceum]